MDTVSPSEKWLQMHYEANQTPMILVRRFLKTEGYDLSGSGAPPRVWNELEDIFYARYLGAPDRDQWDAFREAGERLSWGPAQVSLKAEEEPRRTLRDNSVAVSEMPRSRKAEARSRMAARGHWLRWFPVHPDGQAFAPKYEGDVGVDLMAVEDTPIADRGVTYVRTGVAFAAPAGYWIYLVGRSSLAAKLGLACVPGVIDHGYRGEMLAGLYKIDQTGNDPTWVTKGTRIVQAILMPVTEPVLEKVAELPPSDRGHNGFGSTGGH